MAIGFAISAALALAAHRRRALERPIVAVTLVLYTIPSIALFELLVPIRGLGLSVRSAEVALVSYTLLILFRNILTGLREVPEEVLDAARGMGMSAPPAALARGAAARAAGDRRRACGSRR